MIEPEPLVCGIELGGSKCVGSVGTGPDDLRGRITIPTGRDAAATLQRIVAQMLDWQSVHGPIAALGIASFGPVDLSPPSRTYGHITTTPKPGWRFVDVVGTLTRALSVPTRFDTDVNGAAVGEGRWGAARGLEDFAYVTVGTGIGVGLVVNGRPVHGFGHPELGHVRLARDRTDAWPGSCELHGDCVEGLASATAIAARAGVAPDQVPADSEIWHHVAHALAQLLHTLVLATAPRRIILGGGVLQSRPELLVPVRAMLLESLNGYLDLDALVGPIDDYVVTPGLGPLAGPMGALALAVDAHRAHTPPATG